MKKAVFQSILFFICLTPLGLADQLILIDGRVVENCKLETVDQELFVVFPHGRLRIPPGQIKEIIHDWDTTYKPKNEFEKEQLEKGFVFFKNTWMTKRKWESLLEERRIKREKRLEELNSHIEWENAWLKETKHFLFRTNTSEELLIYYSGLFESFYRSFTKQWGVTFSRSGREKKPEIHIYRDRQQYIVSGAPPGTSGVFYSYNKELKLYHDPADPRFTLDVLFHECTHLMTHLMRTNFNCPVWVDEGLAEYYGSSIIEGEKINCGVLQEGRLAALRYALAEGLYIPLEKMLLTPRDGFETVHYAEAWCLIHFLLEHKKYRSRFSSFFSALMTGLGTNETVFTAAKGRSLTTVKLNDVFALFKKKMGVSDLSEFEKEFLNYIVYGLPEIGARGYVDSARIRIRRWDLEGALDDLETAINYGSQDGACYVCGGRIFSLQDEYEKAAAHYLRAIELDPFNPDYHLELGLSLRSSRDSYMIDEGLRHIYLAKEISPFEPRFVSALEKAICGEDIEELIKLKKTYQNNEAEKKAEEKKKRDSKEK